MDARSGAWAGQGQQRGWRRGHLPGGRWHRGLGQTETTLTSRSCPHRGLGTPPSRESYKAPQEDRCGKHMPFSQ